MTLRLPLEEIPANPSPLPLGPGAVLLRGFSQRTAGALVAGIGEIAAASPFRHMVTPGGWAMSVAMTNCGDLGWVTDRAGYRYEPIDPASGRPWPAMPRAFADFASTAAAAAGFDLFRPDACLVNRYASGSRLALHQDRNEREFDQPIVSVSLGLPAVFLWGGSVRTEPARRVPLAHGDVVVWGGPDRLRFHGVRRLAAGAHPLTGGFRFNLTFRTAGR